MDSSRLGSIIASVSTRIIACVAVLLLGVSGMLALAGMKKPPTEAAYRERPLRVDAVRVQPEDVPVVISGFGEVQALDVVAIAPEVSGNVVEVHPRLEMGEIIRAGEVLFRVDPRNYEAAAAEADAAVELWANTIARLEKQLSIDRDRLTTLERNRELALAEFERVGKLLNEDNVGTRSGVEAAEQAYNRAYDQAAQLAQAVELYPFQIQEARSNLASAEARRNRALADLDRCVVQSPFDARIKRVSAEAGQYVMPGQSVLTLANDSVLEIHVPLDSRNARDWLSFNGSRGSVETAWFDGLEPVPCTIRWTEDRDDHCWEGYVHRIAKFEPETRTLTVAVRIPPGKRASSESQRLPLVEGMFCSVEIPGRTLRDVFRLPRWAVSFQNTVYAAVDNRLVTVPVDVARVEGDLAFVSSGLRPGDIVIINRLIDPLENSLLAVAIRGAEDTGT